MGGVKLPCSPALPLCFAVLALALGACREKPATTAAPAKLQTFTVKGVVEEVLPNRESVVIRHEEIPGYMEAMTMPFSVKRTNEVAGLVKGARVSFRLMVTADESWIEQITQLGGAPKVETPSVQSFRRVRDVEQLQPGDALPNYPFTNQLGQAVSTGQFKGQALALTFIFTRCPLPDFCPRMSKNFTETQKLLAARADGPTNWHLMTISFDPEFDTPAVLKSHSQFHSADPQRWDFVTGAMIEIDAITEQFGMMFSREPGKVAFDHKLRTAVIDASGKVQRILLGNSWKPEELVEEMVKAAAVK